MFMSTVLASSVVLLSGALFYSFPSRFSTDMSSLARSDVLHDRSSVGRLEILGVSQRFKADQLVQLATN
jgi:hypothetical protein